MEKSQTSPKQEVSLTETNDQTELNTNDNLNQKELEIKKSSVLKIFIGGIPPTTTNDDIQKHFSKYTEVESIEIIVNEKTKKFKGFANQNFKNPVSESIFSDEHNIKDRKLEVRPFQNSDEAFNKLVDEKKKKMFIGGLPNTVDQNALKNYFEKFGKVATTNIVYDHKTQKSRGFAFVMFEDVNSIDLVMKSKDKHVLDGKSIECKPALLKEDQYSISQLEQPVKKSNENVKLSKMKNFERKVTQVTNESTQQEKKNRQISGKILRPKRSMTQNEDTIKTEATLGKLQNTKEEYKKKKLRLSDQLEKQMFFKNDANPKAYSTNNLNMTNNMGYNNNNYQGQAMSTNNFQFNNNQRNQPNTMHSVNLQNNIVYPQIPAPMQTNSNFSNYNQSVMNFQYQPQEFQSTYNPYSVSMQSQGAPTHFAIPATTYSNPAPTPIQVPVYVHDPYYRPTYPPMYYQNTWYDPQMQNQSNQTIQKSTVNRDKNNQISEKASKEDLISENSYEAEDSINVADKNETELENDSNIDNYASIPRAMTETPNIFDRENAYLRKTEESKKKEKAEIEEPQSALIMGGKKPSQINRKKTSGFSHASLSKQKNIQKDTQEKSYCSHSHMQPKAMPVCYPGIPPGYMPVTYMMPAPHNGVQMPMHPGMYDPYGHQMNQKPNYTCQHCMGNTQASSRLGQTTNLNNDDVTSKVSETTTNFSKINDSIADAKKKKILQEIKAEKRKLKALKKSLMKKDSE